MTVRPTKVLFVSNQLSTGGAERFVSNALVLLDQSRFEAHLALFRDDIVYQLPEDVGLHVLHKYGKSGIPRAIWRLKRLIEALKPDVVISPHSGINHFVGEALNLSRHKPRWIARIAISPEFEDRGLYGRWSRRVHPKADHVIVNAEALRAPTEALLGVPPGKIRRLYNPADFSFIDEQALAAPSIELPKAPMLLAIGRLEVEKQFDLLLRAFASVREQVDCRLVILGEGSLRGELEREAAALGIEGVVSLPGFLANPYPVIGKADLFVMSSDYEGLPNALIEAQGLGVAAISTDCPTGPGEIIEDGVTGLLVPVGDHDALAGAMADLLGDPVRRAAMGEAARISVRRRFDAASLGAELNSLIAASIDA